MPSRAVRKFPLCLTGHRPFWAAAQKEQGSGQEGPMSFGTGVNFQMFREGKIEVFRAIFHVIQWEFYIFSIFHKFSMLFNENFTFWAAALKGPMTYAVTQGKFLLLLLRMSTPSRGS